MLSYKEYPGWTKSQYFKLALNGGDEVSMGCRVALDDMPKVYIISESAAVFGQDAVPPPVTPGGLTKNGADYLVLMADHVRLEKEAQFFAKIRSMSITEELHVTLPELQIANSEISATTR